MKIAICQLITPNIDAFARYSAASTFAYCQRHGYAYFIQREKLIDDMHINWTKIKFLEDLMKSEIDFAVLIDADVLITDPSKILEEFIATFDEQTLVAFTEDTNLIIRDRPNVGFILIKNNREGKQIINKWLEAALFDRKLADKHPRNQRIYWKYIQPEYAKNQLLIKRKEIAKYFFGLNGLFGNGQFAYHFDQTNFHLRVSFMAKEYKSMKVDKYFLNRVDDLFNQKSGLLECLI